MRSSVNVISCRQCDLIGRFFILGEFSHFGRIFSFWANFLILGEFSHFGRIFSFWANYLILGEFSHIGRFSHIMQAIFRL
jgi:hypothetical protein